MMNFNKEEPVAIVGIGCRFPDAIDKDEFYDNLCEGRDSVVFFSRKEMLQDGAPVKYIDKENYANFGSFIKEIDKFDFEFFGIEHDDAVLIDPQQRIALESAYVALEDSGYLSLVEKEKCRVGVFAGVGMSLHLQSRQQLFEQAGVLKTYKAYLSNLPDNMCHMISEKLNLKGPSIGVQTACSSSLTSIHLACKSLRDKECDIAIAGGVYISTMQKRGYLYDPEMFLSPDPNFRFLDVNARGAIPGNGCGMIVLAPLKRAVANLDHIYAIIRGSAIYNSGRIYDNPGKIMFDGQRTVINEVLEKSGISVETVDYIEANGLGHFFHDSIELEVLTKIFKDGVGKQKCCAIGSVKSNIGYTLHAAGVASVIKTALAIKNKKIFATLGCQTPHAALERSPFYLNTNTIAWQTDKLPRRAGVNCFALGGLLGHLLLEEYIEPEDSFSTSSIMQKDKVYILTLSAKTKQALCVLARKYYEYFSRKDKCSLEEFCFTANFSRKHYEYRLVVTGETYFEISEKIEKYIDNNKKNTSGMYYSNSKKTYAPQVSFVLSDFHCTSLTHEWWYYENPIVQESIDLCIKYFNLITKDEYCLDISMSPKKQDMVNAFFTFTINYSFLCLWRSWGIIPQRILCKKKFHCIIAAFLDDTSIEESIKKYIEWEGEGDLIQVWRDGYFGMPSQYKKEVNNELIISFSSDYQNEILRQYLFQESFVYQLDFPAKCGSCWEVVLHIISRFYINGGDVKWDKFMSILKCNQKSIPTYTFDKLKCALE